MLIIKLQQIGFTEYDFKVCDFDDENLESASTTRDLIMTLASLIFSADPVMRTTTGSLDWSRALTTAPVCFKWDSPQKDRSLLYWSTDMA